MAREKWWERERPLPHPDAFSITDVSLTNSNVLVTPCTIYRTATAIFESEIVQRAVSTGYAYFTINETGFDQE